MNLFYRLFLLTMLFSVPLTFAVGSDDDTQISDSGSDSSGYDSNEFNFDDFPNAQPSSQYDLLSELDDDIVYASDSEEEIEFDFDLTGVIHRNDLVALQNGIEGWYGTEQEFINAYGNPVTKAIVYNKIEALKYILTTKFGVYHWINKLDEHGLAPIHYIRNGDKIGLEMLKLLLLNGADINKKYLGDGGTLLWKITYNNGLESDKLPLVKALLGYGANKMLSCKHRHQHLNHKGCHPEDRAYRSDFKLISKYLKYEPSLAFSERYLKAKDETTQAIIFKQAALYEAIVDLRDFFCSIKNNKITKRILQSKVIGAMIDSGHSRQLAFALINGFYFSPDQENLIKKHARYLSETEHNIDDALELFDALSIGNLDKKIRSNLYNLKFTDTVISFNPHPTPVKTFSLKKRKRKSKKKKNRFVSNADQREDELHNIFNIFQLKKKKYNRK